MLFDLFWTIAAINTLYTRPTIWTICAYHNFTWQTSNCTRFYTMMISSVTIVNGRLIWNNKPSSRMRYSGMRSLTQLWEFCLRQDAEEMFNFSCIKTRRNCPILPASGRGGNVQFCLHQDAEEFFFLNQYVDKIQSNYCGFINIREH